MNAKHYTRRPSHPICWMKKPKSHPKKEPKSLRLPCPIVKSAPEECASIRDADGFYVLVRKAVTS